MNQLKHYGTYTMRLRACHAPENDTNPEEKRCSESITKEIRVLHKAGADDIVSEIKDTHQNDTDTVWLSWEPPKDPNELILRYTKKELLVPDTFQIALD